tara:strand:+ start:123 stop:3413 length:3291 start_codon:yes stop_codon:yes gene_type:complete
MKIIKTIIVSIIFLFSLSLYSEDSTASITTNPETCGLTEDGNLKRVSGDICQEDIAFRALYDIFPSFFDNYVFKVIEFDYISEIENTNMSPSEETNRYIYTNLFENIFSTLSQLSLTFILLIILYHLIVGIIKSLDSGTFLVEEKDRKNVYGFYLLGIFLSLPIGNLLIIHIVLLLVFIFSIIPANLIFTYFLTGVLSGFSPNTEYNTVSENNPNYLASYNLLDEFTKAKICKFNSTNYLLRNRVDDYEFNYNYSKYKTCFVPSNDIVLENDININNEDQSNYGTYRAKPLEKSKTNYVSSLVLGKLKTVKNCQLEDSQNYKCSTIKINNITKDDSYIISDIISYNRYKNAIKALAPEIKYAVSSNKNKIKNQFEDLKLIIENFDYEVNSEVKKPNVTDLQYFSYLFHKDVMNSITIGTIEYQTNQSSNPKNTILYKENESLLSIQNSAITLSHLLKKIDCLKNYKILEGTDNLVKGLQKNKMTTCLNPNNNRNFIGYINPEKELEAYKNKYKDLLEEYRKKRELLLKEITDNRTYVLQSFDETIVDIADDFSSNYNLKKNDDEGFVPDSEGTNLKDIRRQGFMGYAGLITKTALISSNIPQYRDNIIYNYTITPNYNNKLISQTVYDAGYEFNNDFNNILEDSKILNETPEYVKQNKSTRPSPKFNSERDFDVFFFLDLLKPIKESFNLTEFLKEEDAYQKLCVEDPTKCPIPKINPISTINQLGSTYIDQGLSLVGVGIVSGLSAAMINNVVNKKRIQETDSSGIKEKTTRFGRPLKSGAKQMFDFIYQFIGILVLIGLYLLIIGFIMMVAIPLFPFIYMLTAFIEWLILFLSILVISPVFVGYLFNYKENQREIKSFLKNSILKILVKPTLLIISMLFLYAFFYVVMFFINITFFTYADSMNSSNNMLTSLVSSMLFGIIFGFIIFILLKWLFTTIDNFNNKTFKILGIETSGDQSQNNSIMGDIVALSLYQGASQKVDSLSNKLSGVNRNISNRNRFRKQLENRTGVYAKVVNGEYKEGENILEYNKKITDENGKNTVKTIKLDLDTLKDKSVAEREAIAIEIISNNEEEYGKYYNESKDGFFKNFFKKGNK